MELLKIEDVSKSYGGNRVLEEIEMSIKEGEIHGLIGENGAGKSTLMNILFGMPVIHNTGGFEGEMFFEGKEYRPTTPQEAMAFGVGMVHQEFMLIPGFSVSENIKLNRENTKPTFASKMFGKKLELLDQKNMTKDTKKVLDQLELELETKKKVEGMPVGYMQFIEIAREIDKKNLKLLIVDEPTAVLTESEATRFLDVLKILAQSGITILFITHRLDEIKSVCDTVTILRDGKLIKNAPVSELSVGQMAKEMVGREIEKVKASTKERKVKEDICLSIRDFSTLMPGEMVKDFSLDVKRGEILGIAGLAGQGKIGIANGVMGIYPSSGIVEKDGKALTLNDPKTMLKNKMAFLSEDRKGMGLLLDSSIEYNIAVSAMEIKNDFFKKVGPIHFLDEKAIEDHGKKMIDTLDIRCTSGKQAVGNLSGGNQQKVCIARALTLEPDILFVSEPTRGIDIGAKNLVLSVLQELNEKEDVTIIITSSELSELRQIADRIAVITDGKLEAVLLPEDSDELFGLAMAGNMEEAHIDEFEKNV
ncbi:MAG: sugar ABC transporter ATP-binding protein [Tissierellia bacterium]|nr:sugar ABC transporter ATP-binding protein [Tissierellia bacterium]